MFSNYRSKDFFLHIETNEVEIQGQKVKLTPKEIGVLELLMQRRETAVSRTEILEKVWGYNFANDQGLTQTISKLRGVLARNPNVSIRTIPKKGYLFLRQDNKLERATLKWTGINLNTILFLLLMIGMLVFVRRIEIRIDKLEPAVQESTSSKSK